MVTLDMAEMSHEQARWYLAGMIDGEGCVSAPYTYDGRLKSGRVSKMGPRVRIVSNDKELIDKCSEALDTLGIGHGVYRESQPGYYKDGRERKEAWKVSVHKKSEFVKVAKEIPVQHKQKAKKLRIYAAEIGKPERIIEIEPIELPDRDTPSAPEPLKEPEKTPA